MKPGDRVLVVHKRTDVPGFPEVGTLATVVALDRTTSSWPDLQLVKIRVTIGANDADGLPRAYWVRPTDIAPRPK